MLPKATVLIETEQVMLTAWAFAPVAKPSVSQDQHGQDRHGQDERGERTEAEHADRCHR